MARFGTATWSGPVACYTPGQMAHPTRGLVLHIMQGTLAGTDSWFKNPASQASAHFGVGKDGTLLQWVDTDDKAWAIASGNRQWVSLECEGSVPDRLTAPQIAAAAELLAWLHASDGVPLQTTDDPNGGHGLGWHGMGGEAWGHPYCPGKNIVAQRDEIVAAAGRAAGIVVRGAPGPGGGGQASPSGLATFRAAHPVLQRGSKSSAVTHLRALLFVPAGDDFDDGLAAIVRSFQQTAGLQVDGVVGAATWSALHPVLGQGDSGAAVGELQSALGVGTTGDFADTTRGVVAAFQRANGLNADGIAGAETYAAMLGVG